MKQYSFKVIEKKDYKLIKRKIGEGGYGYIDIVEKDNKQYAMKTLKKVDARQIYREIDILCTVDYPTIIKFYGYNIESHDNIVMVFELMRNDNLTKVIRNTNINPSVFDLTKKMICIYGIAKGMEYCHKNNILHRDLKPDNILLNENFEPFITDFGLSKVTDLSQQFLQTEIIGTKTYMSPEMKNDEYCNDKSDVYSFGLIVYFMFKGEDPPYDICEENLESLICDFPDKIQSLIAVCCCDDVDDRYSFQQIAEIIADVDNCVDEIDEEAYTEYVNRINSFQSSNDITNKFNLADSSKIKINFLTFIKAKKKKVINGERIVNIVKKISPDQFLVNSYEGKRNLYLLEVFSDVNEHKLIPKIVKFSKLNHFGILKLKGVAISDEENPTYILKQKVNNGSLTDIIQNEKENKIHSDWNLTKKIITIYGVAKAMAYLHSNNIIHHNLCPNNIFFDDYFYPYITNFEAFIDSDDDPNYYKYSNSDENCIAPETSKNKIANEKTDVYSFAIIMYYIFALKYPFSELSSIKRSKKIISGSRDTIPDEVPEIFKSLISSCWSNNSSERPTFNEIVEQLQIIIENFDDDKFDKDEFKLYESKVLKQEENSLNDHYFDIDIDSILESGFQKSINKLIENGKKYKNESESNDEYIEKAYECFTKVSEVKGCPSGNYFLGLLFKEGFGPLKKSLELASINFQLALESEDQEIVDNSHLELEDMPNLDLDYINKYASDLYSGKNEKVKQNKQKAFKQFKIAADKGLVKAMYNCGLMLFNGDGIPVNKEEASKYYKKAADEENSNAMFNYSLMLLKGDGIQQNIEEGMIYLKQSADYEYPSAMNLYAIYLKDGKNGLQQNKIEAAQMFKKAADEGKIDSMFHYATMKENGDGIDIDKKEALKYYKLMADKGERDGMYHYARMLENGDGIEPDLKTAMEYYKNSAMKKYPDAIKAYKRLKDSK